MTVVELGVSMTIGSALAGIAKAFVKASCSAACMAYNTCVIESVLVTVVLVVVVTVVLVVVVTVVLVVLARGAES